MTDEQRLQVYCAALTGIHANRDDRDFGADTYDRWARDAVDAFADGEAEMRDNRSGRVLSDVATAPLSAEASNNSA